MFEVFCLNGRVETSFINIKQLKSMKIAVRNDLTTARYRGSVSIKPSTTQWVNTLVTASAKSIRKLWKGLKGAIVFLASPALRHINGQVAAVSEFVHNFRKRVKAYSFSYWLFG
jgi:hypothetical protein